jgi:uncharacterized protein (TIGR03792 family)
MAADTPPCRTPLDAPAIPDIDGELITHLGDDGQLEVAVIEHLRVQVPAAARLAWLEAEQASWEPWLQRQPGYLGRELHWDSEHQEGQLLIRWASREQWHAIPRAEIEQVQERFERLAHAALERRGLVAPLPEISAARQLPANPFPLVFSGELHPADRP